MRLRVELRFGLSPSDTTSAFCLRVALGSAYEICQVASTAEIPR